MTGQIRINQRLAKSTPPSELHSHQENVVAYIDTKDWAEDKVPNSIEDIAVPVIAQTFDDPVSTTRVAPTSELSEPRQGRKCCGCCCDYRRAVIIVNIVIMILEAIVLILAATGLLGYYLSSYGGDEGSNLLDKYEMTEMICSAVSIVMSAVAIAGAYLYNSIMVGLNIFWLVAGYGLGIFLGVNYCYDYCDAWEDYYDDDYYVYCSCSLNGPAVIATAVAMGIWIYPHVGFIEQVCKGIMSKDTYAREEFSCCCV